MSAQVAPEQALWPDALPKEPTGWHTVGRALGSMAIFCLPLAALTAIGYDAGPLTDEFEPNVPIIIEGTTHEIALELPWACGLDLTDPSSNTITCYEEDREVQIRVRPAETIDDLELAARRGAREATFNRFALDFPSTVTDVQGGKAAHVKGGTGFLGVSADAIATSPDGDDSGFVINVTESLAGDDMETVVPDMVEHLLNTISFKKIDEGK